MIVDRQHPVGLGDLDPLCALDHVPGLLDATEIEQGPRRTIPAESGSTPRAVTRPVNGDAALESIRPDIGSVFGVSDPLDLVERDLVAGPVINLRGPR